MTPSRMKVSDGEYSKRQESCVGRENATIRDIT